MTKTMLGILASALVAGVIFAGSYTDTDKAKNHGKTGLKNLTSEIDANFSLAEGGLVGSTSANVTNGQEVTLSAGVHKLTGIGNANGETNTITFATPYTIDRLYIVTVTSGSTNDVKIADDGATVSLGADLVLQPTDSVTLLAVDTNKLIKVSASGNN